MENENAGVLMVRREGAVWYLEMSRPDQRNALNAELVQALIDFISSAGRTNEARVVVLSGAGKSFSAGADLESLRRLQSASESENRADSRRLATLFETIRRCPIPIIAKVHGAAIAGGCGLAAACDIAIASAETKFAFSEVRIGFVPAIILAYLRLRIGESTLRRLLLTGLPFNGTEAVRIGLIAEAVPEAELDGRVRELAAHIVFETSRSAVSLTKELFVRMHGKAFESALDEAVEMNVRARGTADCKAGVSAFLDRTVPPWKSS